MHSNVPLQPHAIANEPVYSLRTAARMRLPPPETPPRSLLAIQIPFKTRPILITPGW